MALAPRVSGSTETESNGVVEKGIGESPKRSARKSKKREMSNSDDELATSMLEKSAKRRELESERVVLEQERITIDRQRLEHEAERFEKLQQSTNRRLDLDEKRFAVEVKEGKLLLEERKKIVDVMELLAKKTRVAVNLVKTDLQTDLKKIALRFKLGSPTYDHGLRRPRRSKEKGAEAAITQKELATKAKKLKKAPLSLRGSRSSCNFVYTPITKNKPSSAAGSSRLQKAART